MNARLNPARRARVRVPFHLLLLAFLAVACAEEPLAPRPEVDAPSLRLDRGDDVLTVMTLNVYVGGNVDRVLSAQDPNQIPLLVAETFAEVLLTDFPARAEAMADEIARRRPHLIGLQEISTILRQSPGDFFIGNPTAAQDVVFDYLQILMGELANRNLDYHVAGIVQNADVELPMLVDPTVPAFDDVRLIDHDVVLVRGDVGYSNVVEANFATALTVGQIVVTRGYVALDATVRNRTYRFANTHLEPFSLAIKSSQAQELIAALAGEKKPTIVVGDLNTPAPNGPVYGMFLDSGYLDTWTRNLERGAGAGLTNGHDSDLMNEESGFDQRIDFVLVRNTNHGTSVIGPVFATVWGDDQSERLGNGSGLWPSDHGAVIAEIRLPQLGRRAYAD